MPINIMTVKEDLITVKKNIGSIELDSVTQQIAIRLNLSLIPTIDPHGITVFNRLHFDMLKNEIQQLRNTQQANQKTLDTLESAIQEVVISRSWYIKLDGN